MFRKYLAKLALYNYSIMPTITELNEMIGRIKAVQKRFGAGDGTSKVTDNSFGGRVERAKVRQHTVFFLYKNFFPFRFRKYYLLTIIYVSFNIIFISTVTRNTLLLAKH